MREISTIKDRIREYLDIKGVSEYQFYKASGVSRGTLSNDSGLSEKNTARFFDYAEDANPDYILFGSGEILLNGEPENVKTEKYSLAEEKPFSYEIKDSVLPRVVTVDNEGEENILLVPVSARAGYLNGYGDPQFLKSLPAYRIPKLNNGTFRGFEVKGHSMFPTIHQGSIAIGEWVENWDDIKDNQIYIIVTLDDGIVIKRVMNRIRKYGNLFLKSDNRREYPAYTITPDTIKEIWKLNSTISFQFVDPATLYDRISDLEAELGILKEKISQ